MRPSKLRCILSSYTIIIIIERKEQNKSEHTPSSLDGIPAYDGQGEPLNLIRCQPSDKTGQKDSGEQFHDMGQWPMNHESGEAEKVLS